MLPRHITPNADKHVFQTFPHLQAFVLQRNNEETNQGIVYQQGQNASKGNSTEMIAVIFTMGFLKSISSRQSTKRKMRIIISAQNTDEIACTYM
jgi:hypothetical protein